MGSVSLWGLRFGNTVLFLLGLQKSRDNIRKEIFFRGRSTYLMEDLESLLCTFLNTFCSRKFIDFIKLSN